MSKATTSDILFSEPDTAEYVLTPLGAAIVEAMSDDKRVKRIKRRFRTHKECPASAIFNAEQVEGFYQKRGQTIRAVEGK